MALAGCRRPAGSVSDRRMVTAVVEGFDLALEERIERFAWSRSVNTAGDVWRELVRLAKAGRGEAP